MGNCLKPQSSKKQAYDTESDDGEGWSWTTTPAPAEGRVTEGGYSTKKGTDFSGKITEVKIKISKKQLEQLLSKIEEVKDLRVDQVMTQLMSHRGHGYEVYQHQRPWRPALQSIPEEN